MNFLLEAYIQLCTERNWGDDSQLSKKQFYQVLERAAYIEQSRKSNTKMLTQKEFTNKWQLYANVWPNVAELYWARAFDMPWDKLLEISNDYVNTEGSHGNMSYFLANAILKRDETGITV